MGEYDVFRYFLSMMVSRRLKINDRTLKIGVFGPCTGEEMASILAQMIIEFDVQPDWGPISNWKISIDGAEADQEFLSRARSNLRGLMHFSINTGLYAKKGRYFLDVNEIMAALNRNFEWSAKAFSISQGNAQSEETLKQFADCDAIFMNFVIDDEEWPRMSTLLQKYARTAFVFSDAPDDQNILNHLASVGRQFIHFAFSVEGDHESGFLYLLLLPNYFYDELLRLKTDPMSVMGSNAGVIHRSRFHRFETSFLSAA